VTIVLTPSSAVAPASTVPHKYDLIVDGKGYVFAESEQVRAVFGWTPTFIPRQNLTGDYGDNAYDHWLVQTQRDWSRGEQKKYWRNQRGDGFYWRGTNVDVRTEGQVTLRQAVQSLTAAAAIRACCPRGVAVNQNIIAASTTNLYEIGAAGAFTDKNAHGLGAAPSRYGIATDGTDIYLSTTSGGSAGVRKWDGTNYTTWSANGADALEFLNNTLYGLRADNAKLVRWDSSGTQSDLHQWKQADGGVRGGNPARIRAFGGKLAILWSDGPNGPELWIYDGVGVSLAATFPKNFYAHELEVVAGSILIGGSLVKASAGSTTDVVTRPAVWYFAQGQLGLLWQADDYVSTATSNTTTAGHPALAAFDDGLVFTDDSRGVVMLYNIGTGGVHTIGSYTVAGDTPLLAASGRFFVHTRNQVAAYLFPDTSTVATSGTLAHSLVDYDLGVAKWFKSVKVDADIPAGASIDIAYQLEGVTDGSYTTLVTGAASGTEYDIDESGRSVSLRFTLNKGASAAGPTLKRTYLRAAPTLETFKRRQYAVACFGRNGKTPTLDKTEKPIPRDGLQMAQDLIASAIETEPITITDHLGTYTGKVVLEDSEFKEIRPEEFVAIVTVREV
jgi:hypothetical protein